MPSDLGGAAAIGALIASYAAGATRLRDHTGGRSPRRVEIAAFTAGTVALVTALASPLDGSADRSLTAHMVQHMLLIGVAAPLLVVGDVVGVLPWVLADDQRRRLQRPLRRLQHSRRARAFVWIAVGLVVQTAVVVVWHIPGPYDTAAGNPALHAVEHVSFLAVSMLLWWVLLGVGSRDRFGPGVLALFVGVLPLTALGVLMTYAQTPWYDRYVEASRAASLQDQQIAGVVMWGFGGAAVTVGAAAFFGLWLQGLEQRSPSRAEPPVEAPKVPA